MGSWKVLVFFCFTLLFSQFAFGQDNLDRFGKNRLQFKEFSWRFYSTDNFDIYFYDDGNENAKNAVAYLEEEFESITEILGYAPYNKTKIFLYNSVTDLQQSNIGVNENNYTIAGQTNFVKSQVEIAYPGTLSEFKRVLKLDVTRMLINDMMFGGSLSDMFQNSYLLTLPSWFIEGAAHYVAYGWDVHMDDYIRDLLSKGDFKKLTKFSGKDATIVGQSIWNYIAENYGRSNISNILNLTRIIRNEENSIANTLGLPFRQFMFDWQFYYKGMANQINENYVSPSDSNRLRKKNTKDLIYRNPKISPNGRFLAYSENSAGKYKIYVRDLVTNEEAKVYSGGYKVIDQQVDYDLPVMEWRDNTTLAFVSPKFGKLNLWLFDLPSKTKQRKSLARFNQIKDFDFSQNGRLVILSGDLNGQNDLFLLSMRRNAIKRLTNDVFDDLGPKFIPNTTAIVFSSNRGTDSLQNLSRDIAPVNENYDIYLYDLDTTTNRLVNITRTVSTDFQPHPFGGDFLYLSDQKGIFNLYRYDSSDSVFVQVTNYVNSILQFDLNEKTNTLVYTMLNDGANNIFVEKNFNFNQNVFTPQTKRQSILQAKLLSDRLKSPSIRLQLGGQRTTPEEKEESPKETPKTDTDLGGSLSDLLDSLTFESEPRELNEDGPSQAPPTEAVEDAIEETGIIDTDNYVFDTEEEDESRADAPTFLENYRRSQKEKAVTGPFAYKSRFSADNIVTSWVIDPLLGFGIKLETQMNDILENHKFYGGILATSDLKSGDVFAEYQFLKYMVDYRARFDRNVIFIQEDQALQKYTLNHIEVGASLPLSVTTRVSANPFYAFTKFHDLDPDVLRTNPVAPPTNNPDPKIFSNYHYLGLKLDFVFDNTVTKGLNIVDGTKAKVELTHYEGLTSSPASFSNFNIDARHYQKVHREIIFATRLYYGRFFGRSTKSYLLGGMDNWLFNKTENIGQNDPLTFETYKDNSDILFAQFITPLRGFNYNKFNGENVLLFNAELRFPIIRYFHRGPISSNFLRNLQLVGFYDLGSAWTGSTPFATENSLNTIVINEPNSPFQARIKNFNNPWLYSYGLGLRTVLLGYYMKFDLGWPVENYRVGSPKFYVTLGYDF